ncbi:MAG: hypothetical protein ACI87I_001330 [Pseudoalteromonas tetraodonis]|uniref:AlbA family DNA-binding domain-containing protein n=1 Tax=Pseudoalteromonas tetraodonis TaxID=43659 RepID=UPI00398A083F
MLNYSYYPFKNKLDNLNYTDLKGLEQVAEGWYIDYKRQGLKIIDYAKHISGFANQYGGWLIIGIDESSNGKRTAEKFLGVSLDEVEKISTELREAVSAHINPEVLYEEKVFYGPSSEIGLDEDKAIVIVGIPMSHNTPHIHSSGRVYRRLADQSKPKEENDRYILDELWKRGEAKKRSVFEFLNKLPELPASQSESQWAHIFIKPSESQLPPSKLLSFNEFSKFATNIDRNIKCMYAPMQSVSSTVDGFIARQIHNNDPSLASLSIRWWHDGSVRFDIPLNNYSLEELANNSKNEHALEFYNIAIGTGYKNLNVIDYSIFSAVLFSLVNVYLHILKLRGDKRDFYSSFNLKNIFYTLPYIDSLKFIERIKKLSIPLNTDKDISFPVEPSERTMIKHISPFYNGSDIVEEDGFPNASIEFSIKLIYKLFNSIGIVNNIEDFVDDKSMFSVKN